MVKIDTDLKAKKSKKITKVHLSVDQIKEKISKIEKQALSFAGAEQKKKRLNCLQKLAKLNKALKDPEVLTVDPIVKNEKRAKDQVRRIAKKMLKKKDLLRQKKQEKNKDRKKNCLFCKKCILTRRSYHKGMQREG